MKNLWGNVVNAACVRLIRANVCCLIFANSQAELFSIRHLILISLSPTTPLVKQVKPILQL